MRLTKRSLTMIAAIVLCAAMAIGGTFAYLTDTTDEVANVMVVGNVAITQEEKFTPNSEMFPGVEVTKEITVTNTGRSPAYVRTLVSFEMGTMSEADFVKYVKWACNETDWTQGTPYVEDGKYVVPFIYKTALAASSTTSASLQKVWLDASAGNDQVAALANGEGSYTVYAMSQAVQTDGFDNADAALNAAFPRNGGGSGSDEPEDIVVTQATIDKLTHQVEDGNTMSVGTPEELMAFAQIVNKGNSLAGKTVELTADINLGNAAWTPIGQTGVHEFAGVFDGKNHTISNLNVDVTSDTGEYTSAGLFGWVEGHSDTIFIQNVNINGATVRGNHYVGAVAGHLDGNVTVNNCSVDGVEVTAVGGGDKAGAVVGFCGAECTVTNCSASNSTVKAGRDAGQVIGCVYSTSTINGNSATNVSVGATGEGTGDNINANVVGREIVLQ